VLPELKDCAPGFGRQSAGVGGSVRSSTVSCVDQASCVVSKPAGQGAVGLGLAELCEDALAELGDSINGQ
jgi:hypothetical protein